MNIYTKQIGACLKGITRIDEYLKKLNYAVEQYKAVKDITHKQKAYTELDHSFKEYLACNTQVLQSFRELHQTHNQEQIHNKQGESNGN